MDLQLLDTPPDLLNPIVRAALAAADFVLSPIVPEIMGVQSIVSVQKILHGVALATNPSLRLLGYVVNQRQRLTIHSEIEGMLRRMHGETVFRTVIPSLAAYKEARLAQTPICQHNPKSAAAKAIVALGQELPRADRPGHGSLHNGKSGKSRLRGATFPGILTSLLTPMPSAREILGNFTARDNAFQSLGVRQRLEGCRECKEGLLEIPVERIYGDPDQPRKRGGFDEESLRRTGELIRSEGQLQPIRVRWDQERAAYRIVVGERRWRSAKLVGLTHVKAIVEPDDGESPLIRQIVENLCREDLCPLDRAESYRRLMEQKGWTAAQCAEYLHITPATISSVLRLLEAPEEVQEGLRAGTINQSQAIAATRSVRPKAPTAGRSSGRWARAKTRSRGTCRVYTAVNGCRITVEPSAQDR